MIALTYTLELEEPFLATGLEGDPNSKRSLSYVPGSMIRGALVHRYISDRARRELDANDETDRRLFLDSATRFLNAYLAAADGSRTLPTPATWMKLKGSVLGPRTPLYDLALDRSLAEDEQVESPGPRYCRLENGSACLYEPVRRISVHTSRDRKAGRAMPTTGAVFQYDALAPGQKFAGAVLVDRVHDAQRLRDLLAQGDLWLGGSRSAGYGRVAVAGVRVDDRWRETESGLPDLHDRDRLILTCLSPCIVRDGWGNLSADLHAGDLWRRLGVGGSGLTPDLTRTRRSLATLGGFNRTWGLPLCQVQAISAGSVFVYELVGPIAPERLQSLQETGIGEHRADGFGRIAVNWHTSEVLYYAEQARPIHTPTPAPVISGRDASLARQMAERLLRKELDRNLGQRIQELHLSSATLERDVIKNSQLSRLRLVVRSALTDGDLQRVRTFMAQLKKSAEHQYEEARLERGHVRLHDWIMERLESPDTLWQQLARPAKVQIGSVELDVPEAWAIEYTLRPIDGVLAQAAKDRKERGTP